MMYYLGSTEFPDLESAMIYHMKNRKGDENIMDRNGNIIRRDICTGNDELTIRELYCKNECDNKCPSTCIHKQYERTMTICDYMHTGECKCGCPRSSDDAYVNCSLCDNTLCSECYIQITDDILCSMSMKYGDIYCCKVCYKKINEKDLSDLVDLTDCMYCRFCFDSIISNDSNDRKVITFSDFQLCEKCFLHLKSSYNQIQIQIQ